LSDPEEFNAVGFLWGKKSERARQKREKKRTVFGGIKHLPELQWETHHFKPSRTKDDNTKGTDFR